MQRSCAAETYFNPILQVCDGLEQVDCAGKSTWLVYIYMFIHRWTGMVALKSLCWIFDLTCCKFSWPKRLVDDNFLFFPFRFFVCCISKRDFVPEAAIAIGIKFGISRTRISRPLSQKWSVGGRRLRRNLSYFMNLSTMYVRCAESASHLCCIVVVIVFPFVNAALL